VKGETIGLFVVAAPGVTPDDDLTTRVINSCEEGMGKAFRPQSVRWVSDLPRTRSQKIMRRVVKSLALGQDPGDLTSLENPQAVEELKQV
jgi:acetyl-CoA synthetase